MEKKKITTLYKLSNEEINLLKKKNGISDENNELKKMLAQQQAQIQSMQEVIVQQKAELQSMREVIVQQQALLSQFQQSQNAQNISDVSTTDSVSEKKQDIETFLETGAGFFQCAEDQSGNIVITKYNGNNTDIVIPRKINEKNVTAIGPFAFYNCKSLKNIKIPDSVTTIGDSAFNGCVSLASINIPDSVAKIGYDVFRNCRELTNITVDENNKNYSSQEGVLFNKYRNKLITYHGNKKGQYKIPSGVIYIENWAFQDCIELTSVIIPNSVKQIGKGAFKDCRNLTSVIIPNSVIQISDYAFDGCNNLSSVTIPDGVIQIGDGAFEDCSNLISISIPESVTQIGSDAFKNCTNLAIYGKMFSYAKKYAKQNRIKFKNY